MQRKNSPFEVRIAWVYGVGLPALEVIRRRGHFHPLAFYLDDFIAGAFLLWAASRAQGKSPLGNALLCASWGSVCGGLYYSFFGQLQLGSSTDLSGLANSRVVLVKGLLFVVALSALVSSIRHSRRDKAS